MDRETLDEFKRYVGVLVEDLKSDFRAVAEGLQVRDRRQESFEREVREEFREVKSMIKLSYAEIDRRVTALESDISDLRGRLERVEARLGH